MERPTNNEDKLAWVEHGVKAEERFLRQYGTRLGLICNPARAFLSDGKYRPDLYDVNRCICADLKTVTTPFFKAGARYGLDPSSTVTFNAKDARRYATHWPNLDIYFWVTWLAQREYGVLVEPIDGVWLAPFQHIERNLLLPSRLHAYQGRHNDQRGNAKDSFLLSLLDMKKVA